MATEILCPMTAKHHATITFEQGSGNNVTQVLFSHLVRPMTVTQSNILGQKIELQGYILSQDAVNMNKVRDRSCSTHLGRVRMDKDQNVMPCDFRRMERYAVSLLIDRKENQLTLKTPDGFERSLFRNPDEFDELRTLPEIQQLSCTAHQKDTR